MHADPIDKDIRLTMFQIAYRRLRIADQKNKGSTWPVGLAETVARVGDRERAVLLSGYL